METATQILVIVFFGQALASTLDDCNKCSKNDLMKCAVNYNKTKEYFKGDESCSEIRKIRECVQRFETTCGWTNSLPITVGNTYQFRLKEVDCGIHGTTQQESRICDKKHFNGYNTTCLEAKKLQTCVHAIVPITRHDIDYLQRSTATADLIMNRLCSTTEQEGRMCYKKHYNGYNSTCLEAKKIQTCVQAIVPITQYDIGSLQRIKRTADFMMNRACSTTDTEASICFTKHYVGEHSTCPEMKKLETCVHAIFPVTDYDKRHLQMHKEAVKKLMNKFGC